MEALASANHNLTFLMWNSYDRGQGPIAIAFYQTEDGKQNFNDKPHTNFQPADLSIATFPSGKRSFVEMTYN